MVHMLENEQEQVAIEVAVDCQQHKSISKSGPKTTSSGVIRLEEPNMMSPNLDQRGYKLPLHKFTSSNCNVLFQLYVRKFYNEVMGNDKAGSNDRATHNK